MGYHPKMILAGRHLNDDMGRYVADQVSKLMTRKSIHIVNADILIMGLTFKENCPDIRNTRVVDLVAEFESFNSNVDVYDSWADKNRAQHEYGITLIDTLTDGKYDAIILAVAHNEFIEMGVDRLRLLGRENHVLYDIKYILSEDEVEGRL